MLRCLLLCCALLAANSYAQVVPLFSIKPLALVHSELRPGAASKATVLIPPQRDLHDYSLSMADISALQTSPVVFWLSASAEPFIAKIQPRIQGSHAWHALDVEGKNQHPWLSREKIEAMSAQMAQQLQRQYPAEKTQIAAQQQQFLHSLNARMAYWRTQFSAHKAAPVLLGHDAFASWLQDFGVPVVMYRAQAGHGAQQSGMQELLSAQQRVAKGEIRCAVAEPDVSFSALQRRFPALKVVQLQPMADSIALQPHAYLAFVDATAQAILACVK